MNDPVRGTSTEPSQEQNADRLPSHGVLWWLRKTVSDAWQCARRLFVAPKAADKPANDQDVLEALQRHTDQETSDPEELLLLAHAREMQGDLNGAQQAARRALPLGGGAALGEEYGRGRRGAAGDPKTYEGPAIRRTGRPGASVPVRSRGATPRRGAVF